MSAAADSNCIATGIYGPGVRQPCICIPNSWVPFEYDHPCDPQSRFVLREQLQSWQEKQTEKAGEEQDAFAACKVPGCGFREGLFYFIAWYDS